MSTGEVTCINKGNELYVEWKMDFPSLSKRIDAFYSSPNFLFEGRFWWLFMYPNGRIIMESAGFIDLGLCEQSFNGSPINVEVFFTLKTVNGQKDSERRRTNRVLVGYNIHQIDRFLSKSDFNKRQSEFLSSGSLTVVCTLRRITSAGNASDGETAGCSYSKRSLDADIISSRKKKCMNKSIKCPECSTVIDLPNDQMPSVKGKDCILGSSKIFEDFKELFLKQKECDVLIKVKEQEFPAHKAVLIARSPVFESAFRNDMKEKASGIIDIEDCDPSSFSDFLQFVYCGDSETISEINVFSLFVTADKYDVRDLRTNCMEFIKGNLTIDTFCETITLALQYSETELLKLATDFFAKEVDKIITTVKWQSFLTKNPIQGNELFIKAIGAAKNLKV